MPLLHELKGKCLQEVYWPKQRRFILLANHAAQLGDGQSVVHNYGKSQVVVKVRLHCHSLWLAGQLGTAQ